MKIGEKIFWKKFLFWKKLKNSKFSIFQNFIALLDISLYSWNFAHMLVHPKTTSTPKIIVLTQKMKQIYHFLCFWGFWCRNHKNRRKIPTKKWNLSRWNSQTSTNLKKKSNVIFIAKILKKPKKFFL